MSASFYGRIYLKFVLNPVLKTHNKVFKNKWKKKKPSDQSLNAL